MRVRLSEIAEEIRKKRIADALRIADAPARVEQHRRDRQPEENDRGEDDRPKAAYQISQRLVRTIAAVAGHVKALAKGGKLESVPITRHLPSGCGSEAASS